MEKNTTFNQKFFKNLIKNTNKLLPLNHKRNKKKLPLSLISGGNSFFTKKKLSKVSVNYLDNSSKLKEIRKSNSNIKIPNNSTNYNYYISNNYVSNNSTVNNNKNLLSINEYKNKRKISLNNIPIIINNNTFNIYNKYLNIKFVTGRNLNKNCLHIKSKTNINSSTNMININYDYPITTYNLEKFIPKKRKSSHTKTLVEKRKQIKKPKSYFNNNINNSHRNTHSEGNIHINLKKLIDNPSNKMNSHIIVKNKTVTRKIKELILNKKNKSVSIKKCNHIKNNNNTKKQHDKKKTRSFNFNNEKTDNNNLSTSKLFIKKHKSTKSLKVQIKSCINTSRNMKKKDLIKKNDLILKKIKKIPTNITKFNLKYKKIKEGGIEDILYNEEKNNSGKIDDFDDLNSIIKKIKFEKSNMGNLDIFSVDESEKSLLNLRDTYNNKFDFIFKRYTNNKNSKNFKNNTKDNKNNRNCLSKERKVSIKTIPFSKNNENSK